MPNPNDPPAPAPDAATEAHDHIEPSEAMLTPADEGAMAALEASLSGEPAPEPKPVEEAPPADGDPPAEGEPTAEGEPPTEVKPPVEGEPKTDDGKPPADAEPAKRPSDEFGELPKDVKAETRERFDTMKTKFDDVSVERDTFRTERDEYAAQTNQWISTVEATGATPDQFGMSLAYLSAVNSGTPEGMRQAYDMMAGEMATLAEAMGVEVPGIHDPLAAYPDLQQRVNDTELDRADALELAKARTHEKRQVEQSTANSAQATQQQGVQAGLDAVAAFAATRRAADPQYAAKTAAIRPMVERVIAKLPAAEWAGAVQELYDAQQIAAPTPTPTVDRHAAPVRQGSAPSAGGLDKQAGSPYEAMEMALKGM